MFKTLFNKSLILLLCFPLIGACEKYTINLDTKLIKDGDIIFQTLNSSKSQAIKIITHSKFSHVGIIFFKSGKPFVYEALSNVDYTPLDEWITRGEHAHFTIKRLANAPTTLNTDAIIKLKKTAETFKGRPYDTNFKWSDSRIYCSELVWKIYDRALGIKIGKQEKIGDFDFSHPLVKQEIKEIYGNNIPLNETVVSPEGIYESNQLILVTEQ
jgi:uncharacterized protein YycO